ncbi:MAG: YCF48-related protein [Bacteroidetes bacterium]|nr:YCF48-related protein [Bacteroidota bacterium]
MKRFGYLLLILMIMTGIIINGCKKKENPVPVERKKYAWVSGEMDSTGYGMILYSPDVGETWVRQGQGSAALKDINVRDIWAVDENNVWAVCSGNVILKTLDGGQTWTRVQAPVNNMTPALSSICFVNTNNIWISGEKGTVYRSTDNGNTWTMFDTTFFHDRQLQGIWAITPEKVYVTGGINGRGFIGYTQDGGLTWDSVSPANNYNQYFWIGVTASGNTIVVYGAKSHYMVSTNGGTTWKNDSTPDAGGGSGPPDINHLIMLNSQIWWGALDMGYIYLTNDGGSTWTKQDTPTNLGTDFMVGIDAWDSQLALAVGTFSGNPSYAFGPIIKTSNGGTNWNLTQSYHSNLDKVSFIKH